MKAITVSMILVTALVLACNTAQPAYRVVTVAPQPTPNLQKTIEAAVQATTEAMPGSAINGTTEAMPGATSNPTDGPASSAPLYQLGEIQLLGPGRSPRWILDGAQVVAQDGNALVFYDPLDGSIVERYPAAKKGGRLLAWANDLDARHLALIVEPPEKTLGSASFSRKPTSYDTRLSFIVREPLVRSDLGAAATTGGYQGGIDLAISPDGNTIAVGTTECCYFGLGSSLSILPSNGTKGPVAIVNYKSGVQGVRKPEFSPDGKFIIFVAIDDPYGKKPEGEVMRIGSNGLGLQRLDFEYPPVNVRAFSYSPNRREIALAYTNHIWIQSVDGLGEAVFTLPLEDIADIHWSPDGKSIALSTSSGALYVAALIATGR